MLRTNLLEPITGIYTFSIVPTAKNEVDDQPYSCTSIFNGIYVNCKLDSSAVAKGGRALCTPKKIFNLPASQREISADVPTRRPAGRTKTIRRTTVRETGVSRQSGVPIEDPSL